MTVTLRRLDAAGDRSFWTLTEPQREQMRDLVRQHGYPCRHVVAVEYDVIDLPLLRLHMHDLDEHGYLQIDPGVEVPLRTALPDWWTP